MIDTGLLNKYNVPVPRYTSYPTVPYWNDSIDISEWTADFQNQFKIENTKDGISLYIHLPFCESLCTYCGCNKKITTNHGVEDEYIGAILKEWALYLRLMNDKPVIREIHLGGGTPTFFSPVNLERLLNTIISSAIIHDKHEFSLEGHPNNTTEAHLNTLFDIGFRRVSYGVQDNDPDVQRIINRIQPFENVQRATELARAIGYTSVNFDLIYGLPLQDTERMRRTLLQSISLRPDRVAFYRYAHVPWTSRGQRLFDENDLPDAGEKMKLYQLGKQLFAENGYYDIGMDHFALPGDDLYKVAQSGTLHRNFMGYTTHRTGMLLGLGVSAISDTGTAYAQNEKTIQGYYQRINAGLPAVQKGYFLTDEDRAFRQYILDLSCRGKTTMRSAHAGLLATYTFPELKKLENDGLLTLAGLHVSVTEAGRHFIRNICSAFDLQLQRKAKSARTFSNAV